MRMWYQGSTPCCTVFSNLMDGGKKTMIKSYATLLDEAKAITDLELTPEEHKAVEALEARIKIIDPTWGDSINDFHAIARVILAARASGNR